MSRRAAIPVFLGAVLLVAGCGAATGPSGVESLPVATSPGASASPASSAGATASPTPSTTPRPSGSLGPADFTSVIDNRWLPLAPGTTLTYKGTKDERKAVETVAVTAATKTIDGVSCLVVEDTVALGGVPSERTLVYYAQDRDGNVWSFGEDVQALNAAGHVVATEGWRAGLDGALPAFVMEAEPAVGHIFKHAYLSNNFEVIGLTERVKVPYGSFEGALLTKEWTPLEPDVVVHKYYVEGVGLVRDVTVQGGDEELFLVSVARS